MADTESRTRLREALAGEIRVAMVRRQVTGTALAAALGKSQAYVSRRLSGETAFDVDDLETIASTLDVHASDLIGHAERGDGTYRARMVTREFTDKIALAAMAAVPAPRVASTPVPALADRFVTAALTGVQPSGPRRTAPTGR